MKDRADIWDNAALEKTRFHIWADLFVEAQSTNITLRYLPCGLTLVDNWSKLWAAAEAAGPNNNSVNGGETCVWSEFCLQMCSKCLQNNSDRTSTRVAIVELFKDIVLRDQVKETWT